MWPIALDGRFRRLNPEALEAHLEVFSKCGRESAIYGWISAVGSR